MADFGNLGFTSSPYIDQSVNDALGDTTRAWSMVAQPAYNKAMINSGSFGNSGVQQMNAEGQRQLQTSLGRQANDMRQSNLWQGLGFDAQNFWNNQNFDKSVYDTTFNQNQQSYQNGINLLNMGNTANQQSLGFGQQIQNAPMNYFGQFSNIANSMGQGYGNSTASMSASGSPLMGALGGMQLGSAFAKSPAYGASSSPGFGWGSNWGSAMGQSGVGGADQIYG